MDAMQCLGMPHGPTGGPDRQHSYPSRRNPLLRRHLVFPKVGAREAATRRWTVCAQAPPLSQPAEGIKDASPKERQGRWHRTRRVAVGAAVVLACALGAACLNRGGGAYCRAQVQIDVPITGTPDTRGGSMTVAEKSVRVLSDILKQRAAAPRAPASLHQRVFDQIELELEPGTPKPEVGRLLLLLAAHLYDEIRSEVCLPNYSCLEALRGRHPTTASLYEAWDILPAGPAKYDLSLLLIETLISKINRCLPNYDCLASLRSRHSTTSSLYEAWSILPKGQKYDLGLLLVEIFINKGDYKNALTICNTVLDQRPENDGRPLLYLAIIKMMLAAERMLEPDTTTIQDLNKTIREATVNWEKFKDAWKISGSRPEDTS